MVLTSYLRLSILLVSCIVVNGMDSFYLLNTSLVQLAFAFWCPSRLPIFAAPQWLRWESVISIRCRSQEVDVDAQCAEILTHLSCIYHYTFIPKSVAPIVFILLFPLFSFYEEVSAMHGWSFASDTLPSRRQTISANMAPNTDSSASLSFCRRYAATLRNHWSSLNVVKLASSVRPGRVLAASWLRPG